jgi:cytochrome P460
MTSVHQFGLLALMLSIVIGFFSRQSGLRLPTELSNCRQWRQLLKVPYEVPLELWMRCVAPTPGDWAATRETYGPHTKRFVRIYGNELADESLASEEKPFDAGSIIVKEKLAGEPHGDADGVAFMVKRNSPAFVSTGGWEFLYFPASPDKQSTHQSCATCHKAAAGRDYVFGKYPR